MPEQGELDELRGEQGPTGDRNETDCQSGLPAVNFSISRSPSRPHRGFAMYSSTDPQSAPHSVARRRRLSGGSRRSASAISSTGGSFGSGGLRHFRHSNSDLMS